MNATAIATAPVITVGAPSRLAATRRKGGDIHAAAKEARYDLQDTRVKVAGKKRRLVQLGGDAANGLLSIGGASLVINGLLSEGCTVEALYAAVSEVPTVKRPLSKVKDHLRNCFSYSLAPQMAAAGLTVLLRKAGIVCLGDRQPDLLTVNGLPYTGRGWDLAKRCLPTDKVHSPLLQAIALALATLAGHVQAPAVKVRRAEKANVAMTCEAVDVSDVAILPVPAMWTDPVAYVVGSRKPNIRRKAA